MGPYRFQHAFAAELSDPALILFVDGHLARLLQRAELRPTRSRDAGEPHTPPTPEETAHWRDVVFGRDDEAEAEAEGEG